MSSHRALIAKCNLGFNHTPLLYFTVQPKGRRGSDAEPFMDPVLGRAVRRDTERRRDLRRRRKNLLGKAVHINLRTLDKMGRNDQQAT